MLIAEGENPGAADPRAPGLIADIGGTNVRFALVDPDGSVRDAAVLKCRDYPDIATAAQSYLDSAAPAIPPARAAIAIASPVTGDTVSMTNSTWEFSITELCADLDLERLTVLNDFTAIALAVPRLTDADRIPIGAPSQRHGAGDHDSSAMPIAVLGPGTGLGVSGLLPVRGDWKPLPGEGGHVTMAAATDKEGRVLDLLRRRYEHVSAERVVSGPGLVNLYRALCELENAPADPKIRPGIIAGRGLERSDPICMEALAMFCAMLGTVAGNLCLTMGALGGAYIGGGIVPKLGDYFEASQFRARFEAKGRFSAYLSRVPTFVITEEHPAFLGLAPLVH